ncbi:MAG: hypothetical protein KY397_05390 [Gemmatimonadetes bacterium]|nr:hypothetical protein [Gemmatimonadota bacterium]
MIVVGLRLALAGSLLPLSLPHVLTAQTIPAGVVADTVVVRAASPGVNPAVALAAGESVAVWVARDVEVGEPGVGGRPVPDAPVGAVIARFGDSGPFAWPIEPTVWTAPAAGRLAFGLNGHAGHEMEGEAVLAVARLDAGTLRAFPPPAVELERVENGVRARWTDRAGFEVDRRTLAFRLTTSHGSVYALGSWVPAGRSQVFLPLPPPVDLPPGVHTLAVTITDRLGNMAPPATIAFDTGG